MTFATIVCTIPLSSNKLDENIDTHLLHEIRNKYNRSYNEKKEYYILDVKHIIKTINYISNANSLAIFKNICEVEILPMSIGEWMEGTCEIARGAGIFVHAPNRITKVFIKHDNVIKNDVTYSSSRNAYVKDNDIVFGFDTPVKIHVFNRDFINKNFRYIGDEIMIL